jgi:hypothetical protein
MAGNSVAVFRRAALFLGLAFAAADSALLALDFAVVRGVGVLLALDAGFFAFIGACSAPGAHLQGRLRPPGIVRNGDFD